MPASNLSRTAAAVVALSLAGGATAYSAQTPQSEGADNAVVPVLPAAAGSSTDANANANADSGSSKSGSDKTDKGDKPDKGKGSGGGSAGSGGNAGGNGNANAGGNGNGNGNGNAGSGSNAGGNAGAGGGQDSTADEPTSAEVAAVPGLALGRKVGVAELRGQVLVHTPGSGAIEPLDGTPVAVPNGTVIDARQGAIALASAIDAKGHTKVGHFSGGIFEVRQPKDGSGVTQIVLRHGAFDQCTADTPSGDPATAGAARAHAASARRPVRSLWGSDSHGRFQTRGRGSVATVRGTRWGTEDYCDGTLTKVTKGAVLVRDFARHRTVLVKAGHSYFAKLAK